MPDDGLEGALTAVEDDLDVALKALTAALKTAKKAKAAAGSGSLRDLRGALDEAASLAERATVLAEEARDGWTFDEESHFAGGGFTKEVLALAASEGVKLFESDERILCYPAIVQVSSGDTLVIIDKKKDRRVRPSVLVRTLKDLQGRASKFKPADFLVSLSTAYDLVIARRRLHPGATAKLLEVYAVLTVLPGAARDYTKQEFARDLYLLDESGETVDKHGRTMSLPASALTRGTGGLTTVARSGQEKVYAGIAFDSGA